MKDPTRIGRALWRRKGWVVLGVGLGLGAALAALFAAEPRYAATSRVLVAPDAAAEAARGPVAAQVELLRSRPLVEAALAELGGVPAWARAGRPEEFARDHLRVAGDPRTGIVSVTVAAPDAAFAYQAANALAAAYLRDDQRSNRLEASQAAGYIEEQARRVGERLARAEGRLRSYQARHGAMGLSQQARAIIAEVARLEAERAAGRADIARAERRAAGLRRRLGLPPAAAGELERDPAIQRHLAGLLAAQAAELAGSPPPSTEPARLGLAQAVAMALDARLRGARRPQDQPRFLDLVEAEIDRLAAGTRVQLAGQLVMPLQVRLKTVAARAIDLARLVRDVEILADSYRVLRQRGEEARIAEARLVGSARLLEYAVLPALPASPAPGVYLAWGLLGGLGLGTAAAILADRRSPLRSPGQVLDDLGYPVLGILPWQPGEAGQRGGPRRPAAMKPGSPLAGALRAVRTSIRLADVGRPVAALVVTSAGPGEGRSLALANLAASIAQSGLTVALVDADHYHPAQHLLFGVPAAPGLAGVLAGEAGLDQALVATGVRHLRLLPAGPPGQDPADLAASRRVAALLQALRERFDYVLVDAPSLAEGSDALRLAAATDGLIVFVGLGSATRVQLQEAAATIARAPGRVLGLLIRRPPGRGETLPPPRAAAARQVRGPDLPALTAQAEQTLAQMDALLADLRGGSPATRKPA